MSGGKKQNRAAEIALLALCLCLALGVKLAFHACGPKEDGTWMHCHTAENAVLCLAVAMAALSAAHLAVKPGAKLALDAAVLVLDIAAMLTPGTLVPLCMMDAMRCRAVMKPAVLVLGILIVVALAADTVVRLRAGRRRA